MLTSKKWTFLITGYLIAFVLFNVVTWKLYTEDLLTQNRYYNGGLDRLGYIVGSKHYRNAESTLPRKAIENWEYRGEKIDVLTIGDSFSNVKKNGKDPLYQDWIASLYNYNIINVQPIRGSDAFSTILTLLNSGYLDLIGPRYVIIQIVERNCIKLLSRTLNFNLRVPVEEVLDYYRTAKFTEDLPEVGFINAANFLLIRNSILYNYSDNAFSSAVYVRELKKPFFSVKNSRKLLFYKDDLKSVKNATPESVRLLNDNLNRLSAMLKKKNIKLYFMPAADKYNVYGKFIDENPYPESVFFELLRPLPKRYFFVDTKAILQAELEKGEKDIYYADDSHWSWKAVKKIAEQIIF